MTRAAVALGSNLGDRAAILQAAAVRLSRDLKAAMVSEFIETEAEGVGAQAHFLNGAVAGQWGGDARGLLELLMTIEREAGRARPFPGAPRTLDLDLILFGASIIDEPGLVVPHPRFREREFVLRPLCQIAPDMVDPVTARTVAELYRSFQGR
jgi:2-amino-4-hydroxy-6-hydroxymethyldihydropteridine diphosphokinase